MGRAAPQAKAREAFRFELVDIDKLRGHEQLRPDLLESLKAEIQADGVLFKPILVAERHYVILDGHHRWAALKAIGCRRVPAFLVDYSSGTVDLGLWPTAQVPSVTKDEVVERGLKGEPFTPKTTRHRVMFQLPDRPTNLNDLM
jgi:L-serine kinase (ADP)